jgi:flavodoxin
MKRVLIVYFSSSGKTETMAEYIAEGVRFSGHQAVLKKMGEVQDSMELAGYDGYIFGSPTFSLDLPEPAKTFLAKMEKENLAGKLGAAFGSYRHDVAYQHDDYAPAIILDALQKKHKMNLFELGPFNLKEDVVETSEGMKACHDYGRVFGENLAT